MARTIRLLGVVPLGDLAAYVEFSRTLDLEVNALVQQLAVAVQARGVPFIRDVVPALGGLALHFDPEFDGNCVAAAVELVDAALDEGISVSADVQRTVTVPVCYEPEFALDLQEISQKTGLSTQEIVERNSTGGYRVLMMGFAPGHAYMGGLDPALAVPRRASPRAVVPGCGDKCSQALAPINDALPLQLLVVALYRNDTDQQVLGKYAKGR